MSRTTRLVSSSLAIAALCALAVGCGNREESSTAAPAASEAPPAATEQQLSADAQRCLDLVKSKQYAEAIDPCERALREAANVDVQRAYDHCKFGRFSESPFLDVLIPSVLDPASAPPGRHLMSITAKFGPYELRDGDWADKGQCEPEGTSFEWIVQNFAVDSHMVPAGGFVVIHVPTALVMNREPDAPAWVRFTLSEQQAPIL